MEGGHSPDTLDYKARDLLVGQGSQPPASEGSEALDNYTFFPRRCLGPSGGEVRPCPPDTELAGMHLWCRP
jgi:hypothetical protein